MSRALLCTLILAFASLAHASEVVRVVLAERAGECASVEVPNIVDRDSAIAVARLAKCRFEEGDFDGAVVAFRSFRHAPPEITLPVSGLSSSTELRARTALHDDDPHQAAALYRRLLAESSGAPRETRARLTYYSALSSEASGEPLIADRYAALLVRTFPGTRYAALAQLHFDAPLPAPSALAMAREALEGRHYEAAESLLTLAACGREPCAPRVAARREEAAYEAGYLLGHLLYRYRREFVERSLPWFETWIDVGGRRLADSRHDYAMAVMRMGRFDEARRALAEFAEQHPDDPRVDEAMYRRAWLYLEQDRYTEAADAFVMYRSGGGQSANEASWWIGWAHFRDGRLRDALDAWRGINDQRAAARVIYWSAVCQAQMGDRDEASRAWDRLNRAAPLSYYGVLSARRLGNPLITGARSRVLPVPTELAADAAQRVADLGLVEEARLLASPASGESDPELYALRVNADPNDWIGWSAQYRHVIGEVPMTPSAALAFRLVVPEFHGTTVRSAAEHNDVPPEVVWAVMRKESDFRPDALSRSDAMGLMQVIPQTALAIADRRGVVYVDGMLFEPHHAIEFGAWYLGALKVHFSDQLPLTIVAYNAGPLVVEDWLTRNAGLPYDEFVEEIPFDQARDYVRRVTEYAIAYVVAGADERVLHSATLGGLIPERIAGEVRGVVDF